MRINEINKQLNKILGEDIELVNVDNSPEVKQQKELNESYDTFRRIANVEAKDNQLNEWFDGVEEQKDKHDAKKAYERAYRDWQEIEHRDDEHYDKTLADLKKLGTDLGLSDEEKDAIQDEVNDEMIELQSYAGDSSKRDAFGDQYPDEMGEACADKSKKESDETVKAESKENSKEKTLEESVDFNALFEEEEKKKMQD